MTRLQKMTLARIIRPRAERRVSPIAFTAPPSWRADPWGEADLRYWDGLQWTAQTKAGPKASPAAKHPLAQE